jgi:hypothetical protein
LTQAQGELSYTSTVANNAEVGSAIEPIRQVRGRAAKKAALTRRRKKDESAKKEPAGE